MSESMQHSNSHDEDGRPQSCPSYTETSILDEAIPFIIFTSKQSTVEDELSAADAEALEARLEALQDRQSAQRSLISTLEIRLNEVRARLDEANRPRQALSISRLRPRSAQNAQELEAQCARLQAKRDEVEEAVTATQAEVQSVQDSITARRELQAKRCKQEGKLDRIYERVFADGRNEFKDEREAHSALTAAELSALACEGRVRQIKQAHELVGEALSQSILSLRSLRLAHQSRTQSGMHPSPAPRLYTTVIRRAIAHETSLRVFLRQSLDADPDPEVRAIIKLPRLSSNLGALIEEEASTSFPASIWSAGTELFRRLSEEIVATQRTAQALAREHHSLAKRFHAQQRQYELAKHRIEAARDRLRNIRRTIFIDTLLGNEPSKVDLLAADEDPYTLFTWLKDADEAGKLSEPTSAALAQAVEEAAGEDLPDYS